MRAWATLGYTPVSLYRGFQILKYGLKMLEQTEREKMLQTISTVSSKHQEIENILKNEKSVFIKVQKIKDIHKTIGEAVAPWADVK